LRGNSDNFVVPETEDHILFVLGKNGVYETMLPHVLKVVSTDGHSISVDLDHSRASAVSMSKVRKIINRSLVDGGNLLHPGEYEQLISLMGGVQSTEGQLLDHIKRYISARGYYFDEETVHNYHISLKTRPFVILAGLSGTGKSKLSQLYAEAIGNTVQNERYLRLAVRPSWNDDRYLLGYLNTLSGEYVTEPAVDFIIQAEKDRENLYFFCLDEMNLAHVEHYFSQFLSALEEENPADRRIPLYSKGTQAKLEKQGKDVGYDRAIIVPPNLLFTGTVNVDETTQPLSDKVIDRANTLEFFEVDLEKIPNRQAPPDPIPVTTSTWRSYLATEPDSSFRPHIVAISQILSKGSFGLGYRVVREMEMFMANSSGLLDPLTAFDLQVKQRVLPRVRGTQTIRPMLVDLIGYAKKHNLAWTGSRLEEMDNRLKRDGYTSFWR
jgi:energy-coupling factor transporter ATP-binding protein EcfA2